RRAEMERAAGQRAVSAVEKPVDLRRVGRHPEREAAAGAYHDARTREREIPDLADREADAGRLVAGSIARRDREHVAARRKRPRRTVRQPHLAVPDERSLLLLAVRVDDLL